MNDDLPDAQGKPDLHNVNLYGGARPEPDEIEDRRQRAREAYHDASGRHATYPETYLKLAIETATQVKITPEIIEAVRDRVGITLAYGDAINAIRGFCAAAGFEVIE